MVAMPESLHDVDGRHSSVDIDALIGGVDRPLAQARGVGNGAYTSAEFFAVERDALFAPTWACIGAGAGVPESGDLRPVDFMGLPLLLLRDTNGQIKVFHNVCSHRGVRLVEEPLQVKRRIVCPYHAWSYDLDGRLRGTPHIGGQDRHECEGFDPDCHGLREVRSALWFDLVFVNLSGDAPGFDVFVADLAQRWAHLDTSLLRHGGEDATWSLDLACNWKLAVENHNDAYHLPWVHRSLNSYSRFEDHYDVVGDDHYAGQGSVAYRPPRPEGAPSLPVFPQLPQRWAQRAEYVALFPNAILGVHADHVWTVWLAPLACDRTLEQMNIYYVGDASCGEGFAEVRRAVKAEWLRIWSEDRDVVERMQRGRSSPAFDGGVFSPALDAPTHQFHRWFARRLTGR
jgi:choline monooxygenase